MRLTALAILLALATAASMVMLRSPLGYAAQDREHVGAGASSLHWTGTDDLGRDRTVRLAGAVLLGLSGAVAASAVASALAMGVGMGAAFSHPLLGKLMLFASDAALTLPWLFLLMMIRSALPLTLAPSRSAVLTFLLLGLLGWPAFTRTNHSRAVALRSADWLVNARAAGLRRGQLLRHVLPHVRPLLLSQFLVYIPVCIVAEANLGAMGLGISEPLPSWGSMLLSLQNSALLASSRWVYLPIALLVIVLLQLELLIFKAEQ